MVSSPRDHQWLCRGPAHEGLRRMHTKCFEKSFITTYFWSPWQAFQPVRQKCSFRQKKAIGARCTFFWLPSLLKPHSRCPPRIGEILCVSVMSIIFHDNRDLYMQARQREFINGSLTVFDDLFDQYIQKTSALENLYDSAQIVAELRERFVKMSMLLKVAMPQVEVLVQGVEKLESLWEDMSR